jgi:hypothetical protein
VFGAGKAGRVIAWDRATRRRRWTGVVGLHRNDVGPLPRRRVTVCPGLLGGVETPMAYADGRLFVPVVDLCGRGQCHHLAKADHQSIRREGADDSSHSTRRPGTFCGSGDCPRPTSAARRCRTTSSSLDVRRVRLCVHRRRGKGRLARTDAGGHELVPCRGGRSGALWRRGPAHKRCDAGDRGVRPALMPICARRL